MFSILSHSANSYAEAIRCHLGKGATHARLIYREWCQTGRVTGQDPHFKNAQALFDKIVSLTDFSMSELVKKGDEELTAKYLLKTRDRLVVEMVLLPMSAGWTLCLSSQVGCAMGCAFCETGKMGLVRSLSAEEIVSQLFHAKHSVGVDVRNIVFMGMGEPLDNYESVMEAVRIFTDPFGFNLGPRHITISTSGLVEKIYRLIEEADPALNLAVSVNAPNEQVRNQLMPINKRHDMHELKKAMKAYCSHPRRRILIEYVLIQGRTDSLEAADELADYLRDLDVTVNLIPYNPQRRDVFQPPTKETVDAFLERMIEHGYRTFVRGTKGQKIMAACGQLGIPRLKRLSASSYSAV